MGVGLICRVAKCLKPFSKEANRAIESREMFAMPVHSAIDTYIHQQQFGAGSIGIAAVAWFGLLYFSFH